MALQRASSSSRLRGELFGARGERTLVLLQAAWPGAVGEELARRTELVALDAGTLRVRVPDAGWRKVLHRMRGDILARLYDVAGEFAPRRLGFMEAPLGSSSTQASSGALQEPTQAPRATTAVASPSLRLAAEVIPDPDLRARFLESAALYLGRSGTP
jgi:Dna[CI] antecedent, DciA